jgi:L-aminopeptidase/D-esterase-like protein
MKIRAQLVLACFLLSVLPLSVIVVYSYESSRCALDAASRREADIDQFAAAAAGATADAVIASLAAAKQWNGDRPPNDDVTFVVVRAKS